ncbi:MAG: hypothetical protein JXQ23_04240 [Clostridia bacterium]|nr:hypothetical protein [Clostridia bacterium]
MKTNENVVMTPVVKRMRKILIIIVTDNIPASAPAPRSAFYFSSSH